MNNYRKIILTLIGIISFALLRCTDPTSPEVTEGTVKISLKRVGNITALGKSLNNAAFVTISSAQVVIEEIEFENSFGDSLDFELEEPFVKDLLVGTTLHQIETIQIPFGSYEESEIEIDELNPSDSTTYAQNPELQDLSILVKGYLNDDPLQTFTFSSALEAEQEMEFEPPLILNEASPTTNIVLTVNMDMWFVDSIGNPLDPTDLSNKNQIEENIKNSIDVFEDEDDDGEDDD